MTLKEKIKNELMQNPGLTDTQLEMKFNVVHQAVNQECRDLEHRGELRRDKSFGIIRNFLTGNPQVIQNADPKQPMIMDADGLHEESIKEILNAWLRENGWNTKIAWGKEHGIDILATRGFEKWIIEVKGCGSRNPMRVNYFLSILGETLQRMDDADAKYSIALPNMQQYRNLWNRLPQLAKERTQISAIFVSEDGQVTFENRQ